MRHTLTALTTSILVLATTATAWAGGWAIISLDSTPGEMVAGETYEIGYTILQHGRHPVAVDRTEIRVLGPTKVDTHVFAGVGDGPEGHYVAEVTFPRGGIFQWEVTQGDFPTHDLGTIQVGDALPTSSTARLSILGVLRAVLPAATLISASFAVTQMIRAWPVRQAADAR